jgi:hypothetical protein
MKIKTTENICLQRGLKIPKEEIKGVTSLEAY